MDLPITLNDLDDLIKYYNNKYYSSLKSEAYFVLSRISNQLVQLRKELSNYLPELQAPYCQQLHAAVQMENYCIVCLKFVNPQNRQQQISKIHCPSCQAVVFCSGYCSLEANSHLCDILTHVKMRKLYYDPEIQTISFNQKQVHSDLPKLFNDQQLREQNIQNLETAESESLQLLQDAGSSSVIQMPVRLKQLYSDTELQQKSDRMNNAANSYIELQIKPIYQSILTGQKLLYGENNSQEIKQVQNHLYKPRIDPFLYSYFLRICQILSDGIRKMKKTSQLIETKSIDINSKVSQIDEFQSRMSNGFQEYINILKQSQCVFTLPEIQLMHDKLTDVFLRLQQMIDQQLPAALFDLNLQMYQKASQKITQQITSYAQKYFELISKKKDRFAKITALTQQLEQQTTQLQQQELTIDMRIQNQDSIQRQTISTFDKFLNCDLQKVFSSSHISDVDIILKQCCAEMDKEQRKQKYIGQRPKNQYTAQNVVDNMDIDNILQEGNDLILLEPTDSINESQGVSLGSFEAQFNLSQPFLNLRQKKIDNSQSKPAFNTDRSVSGKSLQMNIPKNELAVNKPDISCFPNQIVQIRDEEFEIQRSKSAQAATKEKLLVAKQIREKHLIHQLATGPPSIPVHETKYISKQKPIQSPKVFKQKSFTRKVVFHRNDIVSTNIIEDNDNLEFIQQLLEQKQGNDFEVKRRDWKSLQQQQLVGNIFNKCASVRLKVQQSKMEADSFLTVINYKRNYSLSQRSKSASIQQNHIQIDTMKMRPHFKQFIHQLSKNKMHNLIGYWCLFYQFLVGVNDLSELLVTDIHRLSIKREGIQLNFQRLFYQQKYSNFCVRKLIFQKFNYLTLNQNMVNLSFQTVNVGYTIIQQQRAKQIFEENIQQLAKLDYRILPNVYNQLNKFIKDGDRIKTIAGIQVDKKQYENSDHSKLFQQVGLGNE